MQREIKLNVLCTFQRCYVSVFRQIIIILFSTYLNHFLRGYFIIKIQIITE